MSENEGKQLDHDAPRGLVESANQKFVGLAGIVFRAVTWRPPFLKSTRERSSDPGRRTPGKGSGRAEKLASALGMLSLDPEELLELARKVDNIVKRSFRGEPSGAPESGDESEEPVVDERLQGKLRELFHEDPWHRLAAARWIRENCCHEAITTLEGVLSIEERPEVRTEIGRALAALGAPPSHDKGEMRCSRSSEVSL